MVHRVLGLVKKELRMYLNSPIAYLLIFFFAGSASIYLFYVDRFLASNVASLRSYFGIIPLLFVFVIPAVTMRSFAEERRGGTDELLFTLPIRLYEVVAGKFIAALSLMSIMLLATLPVPWTITPLGVFDTGEIMAEYIGLFLLAGAGISFGIFVSSFARHQISSFIIGLAGLLGATTLGNIVRFIALPDPLSSLLRGMSFQYRFQPFVRGVIDTRDVVFFLLVTFIFLYGTTKALVFRKWR